MSPPLIITGRESLAASVPLNLLAIRLTTAVAPRGNVIFSPHSIASSLALLHRISAGETALEIEQALMFDGASGIICSFDLTRRGAECSMASTATGRR
jgi:serine protease inhibitor